MGLKVWVQNTDGKDISSTSKESGLVLGHTKPPIKWALEFFPGVRI